MIHLEIANNRTRIVLSPPAVLDELDRLLRYPTDIALAKEAGHVPPEEGAWDGWKRMVRRPRTQPPWFPTGLLGRVRHLLEHWRVPLQVTDLRERVPEDVPDVPELSLRDYQVQAADAAVAAGRGVLDMPPRAGKTRTMCEIVRRLSLPTVWMAPTEQICRQTVDTLEEVFGRNYAHLQVGAKLDPDVMVRRVVVCTAATAAALPAEFYATREVLVVDEFHHGGAKTYRDIFKLCDHVYWRFGMTGTFFRSGEDEMEMHALLSHTVYRVDPADLLARGYLVPTRVVFVPVEGRLRCGSGTFNMAHGKHGVHEHPRRNQLAAMATVLLRQTGRKVLVLVGTKKQGRDIRDRVASYLAPGARGAEFDPVEFVSTDVPRPAQRRIIKAFLETDEVGVLVGTSLLGEGADLPACDALVYARGEKAEVTLTQGAYRVCTATPGKEDAVIVDFADRHHTKLASHSMSRLGTYYGVPIFDVSVLQSMEEFVDWLRSG